ncbi:MAG: hypothetical protein LBI38_03255 [Oscillospiraceae bacterium]|jgi:hypothetical protein|nr:hypothetical protein [Oscillospiraceae bacterium]
MIGCIILGVVGGLALLAALLLSLSVKADIEYENGFTVRVRYGFITLYPRPEKKKKPPRQKKIKAGKAPPSSGGSLLARTAEKTGIDKFADDVKKKGGRDFSFEKIKAAYDGAKAPLKRFIQKLRVEKLWINCVVGGDDAAKIALSYGAQSAVINAFLAWLKETVRLQIAEVRITADFLKEETEQRFKCRVRTRLFTAFVSVVQYAVKSVKTK